MNAQLVLPSDDPEASAIRLRLLAEWWSALRTTGDAGATTWEVLEELEQKVTDCITIDPPDLGRAESLTAQAMHLIAGHTVL